MPSPLRLRAEQCPRWQIIACPDRVGIRQRLESGQIHGEGELPVADGHRALRIEILLPNVVPADQCLPVDGVGGCGGGFRWATDALAMHAACPPGAVCFDCCWV
ncbi:hypothetical protein D9M72_546520 [compost metagenome]